MFATMTRRASATFSALVLAFALVVSGCSTGNLSGPDLTDAPAYAVEGTANDAMSASDDDGNNSAETNDSGAGEDDTNAKRGRNEVSW